MVDRPRRLKQGNTIQKTRTGYPRTTKTDLADTPLSRLRAGAPAAPLRSTRRNHAHGTVSDSPPIFVHLPVEFVAQAAALAQSFRANVIIIDISHRPTTRSTRVGTQKLLLDVPEWGGVNTQEYFKGMRRSIYRAPSSREPERQERGTQRRPPPPQSQGVAMSDRGGEVRESLNTGQCWRRYSLVQNLQN